MKWRRDNTITSGGERIHVVCKYRNMENRNA